MQLFLKAGFVILQALALVASISSRSMAQTTPEGAMNAKLWGHYQVLNSPQSRLTFLVQNAYLEKLERDLRESPKLSKFLMESLSLPIDDRLAAIQEYREWWIRSDEAWSASAAAGRNEKSSLQIRTAYLAANEKTARGRYMKLMLEQGFHDFTLAGFRSLESLEGEKSLEMRIVQLTALLGHMVRDQDNLEVLASLSNFLLTIAVDKSVDAKLRERILPHVNELSKKVAKALRDTEGIDVLNPVNLVGGAVFFRGAAQVLAKSSVARSLFTKWSTKVSESSTVAKATALSVGGHAAILAKSVEGRSDVSADQALVQAARERLQNPDSVIRKQGSRLQVVESETLSIDGLSSVAKSLLHAPYTSVPHAKKYGSLIAYAERHLSSGINPRSGFASLSPSQLLRLQEEISARFQRYMQKRGLNQVDEEAIAVLRGYISPYIAQHVDEQESVLVALDSPWAGGNCVTRSLIYTSIFYPLMVQYHNPDFQFGLMSWMDHVEPVLYIKTTDTAIAIPSLKVLPKENRPSLLEPRVIAASFLFRASSKTLHGEDVATIKHEPYAKSKLTIVKGKKFDLGLSRLGLEELRETDPNRSPLVSAIYSDNMNARGELQESMNSRPSGLNPLSEVSRVRDLLSTLKKDGSAQVASILASFQFGQGNPDPMQTELSNWESALASYSRKPTKFPIGFDGNTIVKFYYPALDFLKLRRNPDQTRSEFEIRLQRTIYSALNTDSWRRLKSPEGITLADFSKDIDSQMSIIGFSEFVRELKEFNAVDRKRGRSGTFIGDFERYLGDSGLSEDLDAAKANAKRALRQFESDKSGRNLVRYLEMGNSMSSPDRVRHIQALYGFVMLAGVSEEMKDLFWNLDVAVIDDRVPTEKQEKKEDEKRDQKSGTPISFGGNGKPTLISVTLMPTQKPRQVRAAVSAEVAFLLIHYFSDLLPERRTILERAVSLEKTSIGNSKLLKFASKFFGWMPQIDSFGSWQAGLSDQWLELGEGRLCVHGGTQGQTLSVKRTCEFLSKINQELMTVNEVVETFEAPNLEKD